MQVTRIPKEDLNRLLKAAYHAGHKLKRMYLKGECPAKSELDDLIAAVDRLDLAFGHDFLFLKEMT